MTRPPTLLPILLGLLLAVAGPLRALEIGQTLWGFDGHVVPDCFNPLSVLVFNPGNAPFDGGLILTSADGSASARGGAEYVQPIYLAPHTSRWVQFYIHTGNGAGSHLLRWGRGAKENFELDGPVSSGPPARVWLRDTENPFGAVGASLKTFPDQLFPTAASAAEGLDAVVLDHVPSWEPARREAFLDWVRLGGTVHLLPGADGSLPLFGAGLETLNSKDETTRIGLGRVVHHQITAREMDEMYLTAHGYPARKIEPAKAASIYDLDSSLFQNLSSLTRPKVRWPVIYILVIAYVGAIGPVHNYFRRRLDYRLSIALFLGCVGLFAFALGVVGQRGYGESQTVHSLAIARAMGGGRADVTQWISAFATRGDRYTLTHRAPANLYSVGRGLEMGSGLLFNGREGRILMDIPLYSARAFLHRAIMNGDDPSVTVEEWKTEGGRLSVLRLRTGPGFPKVTGEIHAVFNGYIHQMQMRDGVLQLSIPSFDPKQDVFNQELLKNVFSREKLQPLASGNHYMESSEGYSLQRWMPLLEARALHVPEILPYQVSAPTHQSDLQLLVRAPAPASFQLQGTGFTHEDGWVLYVQDVFKP